MFKPLQKSSGNLKYFIVDMKVIDSMRSVPGSGWGGWELICDLISAQPPAARRNKTLVIANFLATTLQPFKFCCSTHKESC